MQRPAEILQAALRTFARHGFFHCHVDDIAAEAGVSKGAVYLYFDSKAALFVAVIREVLMPTFEFERIEANVANHRGSWRSLLQHMLEHWAETLTGPDTVPLLNFFANDALTIPEFAAHCHECIISPGQRLIERVLSNGMNANEFRALDTGQVAKALTAPFYLLALWPVSMDQTGQDRDEIRFAIKTCIELEIRGLLVKRAAQE